MANPSLRLATKGDGVNASTMTVTNPGQEGDILLVFLMVDGTDSAAPTIAAPAGKGFTQLSHITRTTAREYSGAVFYKLLGSSEDANWSFTSTNDENFSWIAMAWDGVDISDVGSGSWHAETSGDGFTVAQYDNDSTVDCPSITIDDAEAVLVCLTGITHLNVTGISGWDSTTQVDSNVRAHANTSASYWVPGSTGASGAKTITWANPGGAEESFGYHVALAPAPSGDHLLEGTITISEVVPSGDLSVSKHLTGSTALGEVNLTTYPIAYLTGVQKRKLLFEGWEGRSEGQFNHYYCRTSQGYDLIFHEDFSETTLNDISTLDDYSSGHINTDKSLVVVNTLDLYCEIDADYGTYKGESNTCFFNCGSNNNSYARMKFLLSSIYQGMSDIIITAKFNCQIPDTARTIIEIKNSAGNDILTLNANSLGSIIVKSVVSGSATNVATYTNDPDSMCIIKMYYKSTGVVGCRFWNGSTWSVLTETSGFDSGLIVDYMRIGWLNATWSDPCYLWFSKVSVYEGIYSSADGFPDADLSEGPLEVTCDGSDDTYIWSTNITAEMMMLPNSSFPTNKKYQTPKEVRLCARVKSVDEFWNYESRLALNDGTGYTRELMHGTNQFGHAYNRWFDRPNNSAFTWAAITDGTIALGPENPGVDADNNPQPVGVKISDMFVEVICGNTGDAYSPDALRFSSNGAGNILVWCRINEASDVMLRYSSVSEAYVINNTNPGSDPETGTVTTSAVTISAAPFTYTWSLDLENDTVYYFDLLVQQSTGLYVSMYGFDGRISGFGWNVLPRAKIPPALGSTGNFKIAVVGDMHHNSCAHWSLFTQMAQHEPDFFVSVGDESNNPTLITLAGMREAQWEKRGYTANCYYFTHCMTSRMVTFRILSDHDMGHDNSNKLGYGTVDSLTFEPMSAYGMQAFNDMTPHPDFFLADHLQGTTTAGNTTSLTDTSPAEFQVSYDGLSNGDNLVDDPFGENSGQSLTWSGGAGTLLAVDKTNSRAIIQYVSGSYPGNDVTITCASPSFSFVTNIPSGISFPVFSKYGVYQGQVVTRVSDGKTAEVYTVSGTTITFCAAMNESGTFGSGVDYIVSRGGVSFKVVWGNTILICQDARLRRDPDGTMGGDKLDGTAHGRYVNGLYKDQVTAIAGTNSTHIYTSGEYFTTTVDKWDMVKNTIVSPTRLAGETQFSLIKTIHDNNHIELEWGIAGQAESDVIQFYESGASDHGWDKGTDSEKDLANIEAGHVNRTYVEAALRDATAQAWRCMICETPLHHFEGSTANDKWPDFDGMVTMHSLASGDWLEESFSGETLHYFSTGYSYKGHLRLGDMLGTGGGEGKPGMPEEVTYKAELVDGGTYGSGEMPTRKQCWWDPVNYRWYIHENASGAQIFYEDFWQRCSARKYLVEKYEAVNAIWVAADRHEAAQDDAGHADDPWPHIMCGPAHCRAHRSHNANPEWRINGAQAMFDKGQGYWGTNPKVYGEGAPGGSSGGFQIGAFCVIEVDNGNNMFVPRLYDHSGELLINAFGTTLSQEIVFVNRQINETFDDVTGYDLVWTEVTD